METREIQEGFIAITEDKKMLKNYWSGGAQTGTNKQSLTTDIEDATITQTQKELETMINWFNNSHVNKVEFTIKKARRTIITNLEIEGRI